MKRLEDQLQFACAQHLRATGVMFFHTPNEAKRNPIEASRLTALGLTPGVPDLCILLEGARTLWIELKTDKGKVSKHQENWAKKATRRGHQVHCLVAASQADAVLQLQAILKQNSRKPCQTSRLCASESSADGRQTAANEVPLPQASC